MAEMKIFMITSKGETVTLNPSAQCVATVLINRLQELKKEHPELTPADVTMLLTKMLTSHTAMARRTEMHAERIASSLAGLVFDDYMGAHEYMAKQESLLSPAG